MYKLSTLLVLISLTYALPKYDSLPEGRIGHRRKQPCSIRLPPAGKKDAQGRTFLDWNFQHLDVSYNYNYNINCGGQAAPVPVPVPVYGGGGGIKPHKKPKPGHFQGGGGHFQGGGGHFQHGGGLFQGGGGHFQGGHNQGSGLFGSFFGGRPPAGGPPIAGSFSQSQAQSQAGIFSDSPPNRPVLSGVGNILQSVPQAITTNNRPILSGVGSILESVPQALNNNNRPIANGVGTILESIPQAINNNNRPILMGVGGLIQNIPQSPIAQGVGALGQGIGNFFSAVPDFVTQQNPSNVAGAPNRPGGGFFNFFNRPSGGTAAAPPVTTEDPNDIIYNDEKPVNEEHDPVLPDRYSNLRPGQYIVASNPHFGSFVQDITAFSPSTLIKEFKQAFNQVFVDPLVDLIAR